MKRKINVKQLIPIIHFLLSFLYERVIFVFGLDKDIVPTIAKNQFISDFGERVIAYIMTKILAFVLIWFTWKLFFFVIENFKKSISVRILTILFFAGLCVLVFFYPSGGFLRSADNTITYSYAIRFLPEYWHNAYSSYVYGAAMMVFPHPAMINLMQWLGFVFALGYLSYRIEKSPVLTGKGKWFWILIPLIPFSFALFTDAYRTEQYAIVCMIYITVIAMDMVDKKQRNLKEIGLLLLYSGFISVWRTEGIVLGMLSFAAVLLFTYKPGWKKGLMYMAALVVAFLIIQFPHKIGIIKYYGDDYSIVNSFENLQNILNAGDSNLLYEGVEEDLEAIDAITPIDAIQLYGLEGYRRYNVLCGRPDINQSLADDETSSAYLKAYYNLVLHNPKKYIKTQVTMLTSIWGITGGSYYVPAPFEDEGLYPKWTYDAWNIGLEDYASAPLVQAWVDNYFHQITWVQMGNVLAWLAELRGTLKLDLFMYLMIPFLEVLIFFREFFLFWKKREGNPGLGALAFTLLGLFGAIVLVMPAGLAVYFHGYYFTSLFLDGIYILTFLAERKKRKAR